MRALATGPALSESHEKALSELGYEIDYVAHKMSESELAEHLDASDAYIFGGDESATAGALQGAKALRIIAFLGSDVAELVDVGAATGRGIAVTNTPGANAAAVAEAAIALMLALQRQIVGLNEKTKQGVGKAVVLRNMSRRRLGIIGLGAVGSKVAIHATRGFEMDVIYTGPHRKLEVEETLGVTWAPLAELLQTSDFVSIHSPGVATQGLIGKEELGLMKSTAFLINVAKPEVVDGEAIVAALTGGQIAGAAFDGYYAHPDDLRKRFLALPDEKLIVLPRTAWLTEESFESMLSVAISNIRAISSGEQPPNLVNPDYDKHRSS
jgi:glyoxylate reductase